jgi:hypothetical protein
MADNDTDNQPDPSTLDSHVGSADASADDEKRKYIAQNGDNPLAQETAQAVPQPESNEVKDLQNEAAEAEHQAKGASSEDEKEGRLNAAINREGLTEQVRAATDKAHRDQEAA